MSTTSSAAAVAARKLARDRMSVAQAEQRRREAADTEDLAAFFTFASTLEQATQKRDAAIAAANTAHSETSARIRTGQADALRRMLERGTGEAELAALTGLELKAIRALLKPPAGTGVKRAARPTRAVEPADDGAAAEPARPAASDG